MNLQRIKNGIENRAHRYINERRGWKTNRKIIVIESDDWGSIRTPNRKVYDDSLKHGIRLDKFHYCKYDTLASIDDLSALYDVLLKHKDINGNNPIITANTIVANPNFEKIKEDQFNKYHFEIFTDTINKYPNTDFNLWQEGIDNKIFKPQLHGREHLNIERWLKALQNKSKEQLFAFDNNYFGIDKSISNENNPCFLAALDYDSELGKEIGNQAIDEACKIFKSIFNYESRSFIGSNYFWHHDTEIILANNNVIYLQGTFTQRLPNTKKYHYLGEQNINNQYYLIRNAIFEPSSNSQKDWLTATLKQLERSFNLRKPAIISTHRVNFIGSIFEDNRINSLRLFDKLLKEIIKKWPEIEFLTSDQLGDEIASTND